MMNRREVLLATAGSFLSPGLFSISRAASQEPAGARLGIADFSYNIRARAERSGDAPPCVNDPLSFLQHCRDIGAGGMQCGLGSRDEAYCGQLRSFAETHGLFIEGSVSLPRDASDVERFEAQVRTAKRAGASVIRVAIGGRRYEQFDTLEQFRRFAERSWKSMQLAEPIMARHRVHLAIENHKDFRAPEMLDMLRRLDSEYVGVCLDTGNSIALLEDPMEVVRTWAPWARSAHLKDMALCEYDQGFLLADVPLGEGLLDLPAVVEIVRKAHPEIRFSLEMATRDPLRVPCLTEAYWVTLADLPGADLARTLRYVRSHAVERGSLPRVSHLPLDKQVELEEENIKRCLSYASQHLHL